MQRDDLSVILSNTQLHATVQYAPILHRQISDWHVALLKTRD